MLAELKTTLIDCTDPIAAQSTLTLLNTDSPDFLKYPFAQGRITTNNLPDYIEDATTIEEKITNKQVTAPL